MGTRSCIAEPWGDTWRGRYVHWDGYPTGVGASLFDGVRRVGVDAAKKLILDEPVGWSNIPSGEGWEQASPDYVTMDDYKDLSEEDYRAKMNRGSNFSARGEEPHEHTFDDGTGAWVVGTDEETPGCEWVYVLGNNGCTVVEGSMGMFGYGGGTADSWKNHTFIAWDTDPNEVAEILARLEKGDD